MAARFWRWLLAAELVVAAAIASGIALVGRLPLAATLALTLAVFLLLQILLVAASMVLGQMLTDRTSRTALSGSVCLTEGMRFMLEKMAMSMEPRLAPPAALPLSGAGDERPLLLIHGVLCNRAIWRGLQRRLRAAGFAPVRAINLSPLLADIDEYARQVAHELSGLHTEARGARVAILAHSMGGLVARAALGSAGDAVSCIVTIGTPHHGSVLARFAPGPAARQMLPGSAWLERLNAASVRRPTPITSIYSSDDNLVAPAGSAVLANAELCPVQGVGHFGLLHSSRVLGCVLAALKRDTAASEAT